MKILEINKKLTKIIMTIKFINKTKVKITRINKYKKIIIILKIQKQQKMGINMYKI